MLAVTLAGKEPTALCVYPNLDAVSTSHYKHIALRLAIQPLCTYACMHYFIQTRWVATARKLMNVSATLATLE